MAAITQQKYGLWSRRYGSFAGKSEAVITGVQVATVRLESSTTQSDVRLESSTTQSDVLLESSTSQSTIAVGRPIRDP